MSQPTICRVLHEKPEGARTGPAAVSFIGGWTRLRSFDAVAGRLGVKSRFDALRRVCHAPARSLVCLPASYSDLADEVRDASGQLAVVGRNVNQRVAPRNSEVKRGRQLKLTRLQGQLLGDPLDYIDGVSTRICKRTETRASEIFCGFASGMKGVGDGAH